MDQTPRGIGTEVSQDARRANRAHALGRKRPSRTASAGLNSDTVRRKVGLGTDDEFDPLLEGSVSDAVLGVLEAGALGISLIGNGLATARGLDTKHAVRQVDRRLSNRNLQLEPLDAPWVRFVLGERKNVAIALDWTEYARDGHSVIAACDITDHGRATPRCWKTVATGDIEDGSRDDFEDEVLLRLRSTILDDVHVTIVADRGFGDVKLYDFLARERWHLVISSGDREHGPAA